MYKRELYHYNHHHDPANGQFTTSGSGVIIGGSGRDGKITRRDIKKATKQRKREAKEFRNVSDDELQRRINRLKMEQQYKSLLENDVNEGKAWTKKVLKEAGASAIKTAAAKATGVSFEQVQKAINNRQELSQYTAKITADIEKQKAMNTLAYDAKKKSNSADITRQREQYNLDVDAVYRAKQAGADNVSINFGNGSAQSGKQKNNGSVEGKQKDKKQKQSAPVKPKPNLGPTKRVKKKLVKPK